MAGDETRNRIRDLEREAHVLGATLRDEEGTPIQAGTRLAEYAAKVAGDTVSVLYRYDPVTDRMVAAYVSTERALGLTTISLPRGAGITGWVAANQDPITNADATLDLGDLVAVVEPRLRTCLSVPLAGGCEVLTVYSIDSPGFSTEQARLIELAASRVTLQHASETTTAMQPSALPVSLGA
jgi:hypothetical protein